MSRVFIKCVTSLFMCSIVARTAVYCFNFEDRDPLVKKAPDDQQDSYFGFSVALHKTRANSNNKNDNWLLVGAPLGQNLQPGSHRSGALFKCPISNYVDDCEQVETDGKRVEDFVYDEDQDAENDLKIPGPDEIKEGQWLGVSVKSQKPGGIVMVCAHRYIQSPDLTKFHYGQGLCYLLDANLTVTESLQLCKGRPMEKLHQQFGFCQIGTSMSFVGDDFALIGAPGPYTWRGTVFGQVVVGDFLTKDKTIYHGPLSDTDLIEKYSYLGMSVGGGHFFSKKEYTYISGAPRSKMRGEVYFFKKYNNEEFNITLIITGEQFASSFGYEILAVDVNKDGFDDLLVGAPFYYGDSKGGAVYIFYNIRKCPQNNCAADKVLHGTHQSRFGFALTSLGDINKDGYNDVAIGAPYESDHGAIYIYLGSPNGLNDEPSQVIRISQLKTLGYSLSGGIDMDNNGYPDLLVGAYESERVLLFKARPIIDIKIEIKSAELKNINATKKGCAAAPDNNNTCFSFKSCFSIVGKLKKTEKFNVIYQIVEEKKFVSRTWFNDSLHPHKKASYNKKVVPVSVYSKQYCQEELVNIKDGISDILSPIKFRVNYTLENDAYHTPILNKTSVKVFEAAFQKECGDDDICESYLELNAGTNLRRNEDGQYAVNKINEDFILEANISNRGESAYEAKLFVLHPTALSYIALKTDKDDPNNVKCSLLTNQTMVVCDIGNPFQSNRTTNLKLRFEILKDTTKQVLNLKLFVNSTSKELSKRTFQHVIAVLQKIAKFQIRGKASSNLFYGGQIIGESAMKNLEDIGARVIHKYQIDNSGQWDLSNVSVIIKWPIQVSTGSKESSKPGKWLLYLESNPEVSGNGINGYCEVLDRTKVNELNLTLSKKHIDEPENLILPDEYLSTNETVHSRKKRDVNYVVQSQTTEKGGKKRKIVVMDCLLGTAKCVNIICTIRKLNKGNQADIDIRSRIWNSTLVEDYSNVDWVVIKSHAAVDLADKTFNISSESIEAFSAETIAYPEIVIADSGLNWFIIGGAVLAGVLLLIILTIILYKCGFFKRKRASNDPTLSGNLQKKGEADHLLNDK